MARKFLPVLLLLASPAFGIQTNNFTNTVVLVRPAADPREPLRLGQLSNEVATLTANLVTASVTNGLALPSVTNGLQKAGDYATNGTSITGFRAPTNGLVWSSGTNIAVGGAITSPVNLTNTTLIVRPSVNYDEPVRRSQLSSSGGGLVWSSGSNNISVGGTITEPVTFQNTVTYNVRVNTYTNIYLGTETNYINTTVYTTNYNYEVTIRERATNVIDVVGGMILNNSYLNATNASWVFLPHLFDTKGGSAVATGAWDFSGATVSGLGTSSLTTGDVQGITASLTNGLVKNAGGVLVKSGDTVSLSTNGWVFGVSGALTNEVDPVFAAASNLFYLASNPAGYVTQAVTNGLLPSSVASVLYVPVSSFPSKADSNKVVSVAINGVTNSVVIGTGGTIDLGTLATVTGSVSYASNAGSLNNIPGSSYVTNGQVLSVNIPERHLYASSGFLRGSSTAVNIAPFGELVTLSDANSSIEWPYVVQWGQFQSNNWLNIGLSAIDPTGAGSSTTVELGFAPNAGTTNLPTYSTVLTQAVVNGSSPTWIYTSYFLTNWPVGTVGNVRVKYVSGAATAFNSVIFQQPLLSQGVGSPQLQSIYTTNLPAGTVIQTGNTNWAIGNVGQLLVYSNTITEYGNLVYDTLIGCVAVSNPVWGVKPITLPDIRSTHPTNDVGGFTDYFTSATTNAWVGINTGSWTFGHTNNYLLIQSPGEAVNQSRLWMKMIPAAQTNKAWKVTLYLGSKGMVLPAAVGSDLGGIAWQEATNGLTRQISFYNAGTPSYVRALSASSPTAAMATDSVGWNYPGVASGPSALSSYQFSLLNLGIQAEYDGASNITVRLSATPPGCSPVWLTYAVRTNQLINPVSVGIYHSDTGTTGSKTYYKAFQMDFAK